MKQRRTYPTTIAVASLVALAVFVPGLLAGPPLTCFPFQIGNARSLPWSTGANQRDWNTPKGDYDTRRLADDTLVLLGDQTPVIVRMETIRRAALYGLKDAAAAQELLARVKVRAMKNEKGKGNALYIFDYGYLVETYKQASLHQGDKKGVVSSSNENGYSRVLEAIALRGNDPEMEFAAALITAWPRQERHQEHFRKAVAGAAGDALLTENLVSHFQDRGTSLTELRASAAR